jgi:hypothetical protein
MSERLNLIMDIEAGFKALIEVTENISLSVNQAETKEALGLIVNSLKARAEIMERISGMQTRLTAMPEDPAEAQEFEKHHWLCREMAKKLQATDQTNMVVLNKTMNQYMDNVRSAKQSVRAVQAYHMQQR